MYATKVTRKGQITLPKALREKLNLRVGSVVEVSLAKESITIRKPSSDIGMLFGAWSDVKDDDLKQIRKIWRGWNAKGIRGF